VLVGVGVGVKMSRMGMCRCRRWRVVEVLMLMLVMMVDREQLGRWWLREGERGGGQIQVRESRLQGLNRLNGLNYHMLWLH